jgi:hypothetical protein
MLAGHDDFAKTSKDWTTIERNRFHDGTLCRVTVRRKLKATGSWR